MGIHGPKDPSLLQRFFSSFPQKTNRAELKLIETIQRINTALGSDGKISNRNIKAIKNLEKSILSIIKNQNSISGEKIVEIVKSNRHIKERLNTGHLFQKITTSDASDSNRLALRRISSTINSINSSLFVLINKSDPKTLQAIPEEIISTLIEIDLESDIHVISNEIDYIKNLVLIGSSVISDSDVEKIIGTLESIQESLTDCVFFETIKYPFFQIDNTINLLKKRFPSSSPTSIADEIPEATQEINLSSLMENKELSDFFHNMLQIDPSQNTSGRVNEDNTYTLTSTPVTKTVTKENILSNLRLGWAEQLALKNSSLKQKFQVPSSLTFSIEKQGNTITLDFPKPQESFFLFIEGNEDRKPGIKELQYDTKKDIAKLTLYQFLTTDSNSWKNHKHSERDIGSIKPTAKGAYTFWHNLKTTPTKG